MLRKILISFIVIIIATPLFSQNNNDSDISTYYLIRHAEKDRSDNLNKNPDLTKIGFVRAESWRKIFDHFTIDEVYSTNYNRTLHTALPTAKKHGLTIKTYHPSNVDIDQFLVDTKGKSVLIVGHSNTIPDFVNELINSEVYSNIEDSNNDNLYIVTIKGYKIAHILIKMHSY